jgi:hypothetical protein
MTRFLHENRLRDGTIATAADSDATTSTHEQDAVKTALVGTTLSRRHRGLSHRDCLNGPRRWDGCSERADSINTAYIAVSVGNRIDFTGTRRCTMTEEEALAELAAAGFEASVVRLPRDDVSKGTVASEGFPDSSGTVRLLVSSGPETIVVPDVVGVDRYRAARQLERLGLRDRETPRGITNYGSAFVAKGA